MTTLASLFIYNSTKSNKYNNIDLYTKTSCPSNMSSHFLNIMSKGLKKLCIFTLPCQYIYAIVLLVFTNKHLFFKNSDIMTPSAED